MGKRSRRTDEEEPELTLELQSEILSWLIHTDNIALIRRQLTTPKRKITAKLVRSVKLMHADLIKESRSQYLESVLPGLTSKSNEILLSVTEAVLLRVISGEMTDTALIELFSKASFNLERVQNLILEKQRLDMEGGPKKVAGVRLSNAELLAAVEKQNALPPAPKAMPKAEEAARKEKILASVNEKLNSKPDRKPKTPESS